MKLKYMLDEGAYPPVRAHEYDAGMDIKSPITTVVHAGSSEVIDTGLHVEILPGMVGLIMSKSGLNVFYSVTTEGVIDAGYTGSIKVKLYNSGAFDYIIHAGDKITQMIIVPCILPDLQQVDSLQDTERGTGGFGSTGR